MFAVWPTGHLLSFVKCLSLADGTAGPVCLVSERAVPLQVSWAAGGAIGEPRPVCAPGMPVCAPRPPALDPGGLGTSGSEFWGGRTKGFLNQEGKPDLEGMGESQMVCPQPLTLRAVDELGPDPIRALPGWAGQPRPPGTHEAPVQAPPRCSGPWLPYRPWLPRAFCVLLSTPIRLLLCSWEFPNAGASVQSKQTCQRPTEPSGIPASS